MKQNILAALVCLAGVSFAHAQLRINVQLDSFLEYGKQGERIDVRGTVRNASTQDIYFTGQDILLGLPVDDEVFKKNGPKLLTPGATYHGAFFSVDIAPMHHREAIRVLFLSWAELSQAAQIIFRMSL